MLQSHVVIDVRAAASLIMGWMPTSYGVGRRLAGPPRVCVFTKQQMYLYPGFLFVPTVACAGRKAVGVLLRATALAKLSYVGISLAQYTTHPTADLLAHPVL